MKHPTLFSLGIIATAAAISLGGAGCASKGRPAAPVSFATAQPVIESHCIQCHGQNHLAQMPAYTDTGALAKLIGPANWIVPGHPERSRFFQVVTLADNQPGAMPPTGHAIPPPEVERLRAWIAAGAPLPEGAVVTLKPRNSGPRSF